MTVYTIGFSQKSAKEFFTLLTKNKVKKLVDIRLNNKSQLAGFANAKHLPYFLELHTIDYEYKPQFAPSKKLLKDYKDKIVNWEQYEKIYNDILLNREVIQDISIEEFDSAVLLCSEATANMCHRRLFAEYLANNFKDISVKHL